MSRKGIFLDDYLFTGFHATYVRKLTADIEPNSGKKIFNSAVDLFSTAAVIGCTKNLRAKPSKSDPDTFRIFASAFINHSVKLKYIYTLILLTQKNSDLSNIDRVNVAFRESDNEANIEIFESYLLGGIEYLYNHFFSDNRRTRYEDFLTSLKSLLSDNNHLLIEDEELIDQDESVEGILSM